MILHQLACFFVLHRCLRSSIFWKNNWFLNMMWGNQVLRFLFLWQTSSRLQTTQVWAFGLLIVKAAILRPHKSGGIGLDWIKWLLWRLFVFPWHLATRTLWLFQLALLLSKPGVLSFLMTVGVVLYNFRFYSNLLIEFKSSRKLFAFKGDNIWFSTKSLAVVAMNLQLTELDVKVLHKVFKQI